jgi:hypothetical protein
LSHHALADAMRQRHRELAWDVGPDPNALASTIVRSGNHVVTLTRVEAPVPHDGAVWERARVLWREGAEAAARHRAHVVVSVADADASELERSRVATAVIGGLIFTLPDVCAVIWKGKIGRSPRRWLEFSQASFAPCPGYPFMLWMDILPFQSAESLGATTFGLSAFTGREIECDLPGMALPDLCERVGMVAALLVERGKKLEDGATFALSSTDRIKVHLATSRFNGAPALRVGSEPSSGTLMYHPVISADMAKQHPLLILLARLGLFDVSAPANQVQLEMARYESEKRLETYDNGIDDVLSKIRTIDGCAAAEKAALAALARGDADAARGAMQPFAAEVERLQAQLRSGLVQGRVFMLMPKQ